MKEDLIEDKETVAIVSINAVQMEHSMDIPTMAETDRTHQREFLCLYTSRRRQGKRERSSVNEIAR